MKKQPHFIIMKLLNKAYIWQADPWTKYTPLPSFVNKVLLEHSYSHLFMTCRDILATTVEMSSCCRDNMALKSSM